MARGGVIQFRVSGEERARIEVRAGEAGLALSAFVRARALGVEQASVGGARREAALTARPDTVPIRALAAPAERPRFGCPVVGCGFVAGSPRAVCAVHGRRVS